MSALLKLSLHKAGPHYVGSIRLTEEDLIEVSPQDNTSLPPLIIILDKSGSMGKYCEILVNTVK